MQPKHLNTLEFPKILERLAGYAAFSASKTLALNLQPSPYLTEAQAWQAETTEADRLLSVKVNISVGGSRDVRPHLIRARQSFVLTVQELLEIRQTLVAARQLQRTIVRLADSYPRLADIAQRIEECPGVVNAIGQTLDDNGTVKDNASPALSRIRKEIDVAHGRLMEKLNRIISSGQNGHYLQEALVTQRAGRYVIPLKAEFKGRIQGVVHDQSASGATLFIEPLATVELNNKWRQLQLDEEEEVRRILAELSALVGSQADFISHTVAALAELDLAFAKAKYAQAIDAIEPVLVDFPKQSAGGAAHPAFRLSAGRHPLLNPQSVIPIDVWLDENTSMLVITGPNTGGKTVSLKTIGLLAAMAQAGLWIPAAEGSTLPVFSQIFADIGDEQSIEQSLSTFSSHITNIIRILAQVDDRSLVVLDELGSGTDPAEGAALAQAITNYLRDKGATTFIATHYPELKLYASRTEGAVNASLIFDLETLSPTYEMTIGIPGRSNALAIARRLGLDETILDDALQMMGHGSQRAEDVLDSIYALRDKMESEEAGTRLALQTAEQERNTLGKRLEEIEVERRRILAEARAQAQAELEQVREEIRQARRKVRDAASLNQLKKVSQTVTELEEEAAKPVVPAVKKAKKPYESKHELQVGDIVYVKSLDVKGEIVNIQRKEAQVAVGRLQMRANLKDLEFRERPSEEEEEIVVKVPSTPAATLEFDMRGMRVEEGLAELERFLDSAFRGRMPWIRIIHGKGTGRLKDAVRQALRQNSHITSWEEGKDGEGGAGVTVVKFEEE